jgi:hypothetical protein
MSLNKLFSGYLFVCPRQCVKVFPPPMFKIEMLPNS